MGTKYGLHMKAMQLNINMWLWPLCLAVRQFCL